MKVEYYQRMTKQDKLLLCEYYNRRHENDMKLCPATLPFISDQIFKDMAQEGGLPGCTCWMCRLLYRIRYEG